MAEKCLGTRPSASFLFIVPPGSRVCRLHRRQPSTSAASKEGGRGSGGRFAAPCPGGARAGAGRLGRLKQFCRLRAVSALAHCWVSYGPRWTFGCCPVGLPQLPPALEGAVAAPILSRLSAAAVALAEPAPFLLPAMCLLAAPSVLWICPVFAVLSLVNGNAVVLHSLLFCS